MRFTKGKFFFFCFLFIFCSINASISPVKSYVIKYQHSDYAFATTRQNNEKQQLEHLEYILHSCFRLNEINTSCLRIVKNSHLLLIIPAGSSAVFSKQHYADYTAKHQHRFNNFSRYLRYRRLLI